MPEFTDSPALDPPGRRFQDGILRPSGLQAASSRSASHQRGTDQPTFHNSACLRDTRISMQKRKAFFRSGGFYRKSFSRIAGDRRLGSAFGVTALGV